MSDITCAYCGRHWEGSSDICPHCAAIRYLVWDWVGGKVPPSPEDYRRWATTPGGGVIERRQKRSFTAQWVGDDGVTRRVPRVA